MDTAKIERLRKERDDLLQAVEGFRTERDLARPERADAEQQIDLLEGELWGEKDLKAMAEAVTARLAAEVNQRKEQARNLEAEVAQRHDEARKLQVDVDSKPLVFLCCPL